MLKAWLTDTDGLTFMHARMGSIAAKWTCWMPLIFPIYSSCIFSSKLVFSIWFCSPSLQNARCHQYYSTLLSYMNMWLLTKTAIPHFQDPCSQSFVKMHVQPKKKKKSQCVIVYGDSRIFPECSSGKPARKSETFCKYDNITLLWRLDFLPLQHHLWN